MKLCFLFDCRKNCGICWRFSSFLVVWRVCAERNWRSLDWGISVRTKVVWRHFCLLYSARETCRRKNICTPKSSRTVRCRWVECAKKKHTYTHVSNERYSRLFVCSFAWLWRDTRKHRHTHNVWPIRDKSTHSSHGSCRCVTVLLFVSICDVCATTWTTMRRALDAPSVAIIVRSTTIKMWFANWNNNNDNSNNKRTTTKTHNTDEMKPHNKREMNF